MYTNIYRYIYIVLTAHVLSFHQTTGSSHVVVYETCDDGSAVAGFPVRRPPGSFLDFYVQPMTHLVRAICRSIHVSISTCLSIFLYLSMYIYIYICVYI